MVASEELRARALAIINAALYRAKKAGREDKIKDYSGQRWLLLHGTPMDGEAAQEWRERFNRGEIFFPDESPA